MGTGQLPTWIYEGQFSLDRRSPTASKQLGTFGVSPAKLVTELVSRRVVVTSYRVPSGLFTTCNPDFRPEHAYTLLYQFGLCGDNRLPKLDEFDTKAQQFTMIVSKSGNGISVDELVKVFKNLGSYLVIPHYDKEPAVRGDTLKTLEPYISAGEVDSAKKFIRAIKDTTKPTPLLFSDVRASDTMTTLPTRQTFIDCGELTLSAIKLCLKDKRKVALSESEGIRLFSVFDDGQMLSTGLNVLFGERSTGKTFTLDRIAALHENVKYIKQFSLVQQDDEADERQFNRELKTRRSQVGDEYLSGFKVVLDDVMDVDLYGNDREVEQYVSSLLKAAEEADRRDAFSKTTLFGESALPISEDTVLKALIGSVRQLIENVEFRDTIYKHIQSRALKALACELIEFLWQRTFESKKRWFVNSLVRDIRERLKLRTAAIQVDDVDLYRVSIEKKKVERFSEIVGWLQREATILEESIQGFTVVASKGPFSGAGELRDTCPVKTAFSDPFKQYGQPYPYLRALLAKEDLPRAELYKLFAKISYKILNQDGYPVSGGERSEFRLLQEIKDAQNYDILLIDEPESSFDNLFLKSYVNEIIKKISESMPVVVVTHNNTVGASVAANYQLYASKEREGDGVVYRLYSGYPTDRKLTSPDGKTVSNYATTLNSLEAGCDAYNERRIGYEAIKD